MYSALEKMNTRILKTFFIWTLLIVTIAGSFKISDINIKTLFEGLSNSIAFIKEMLPPDFSRFKKILLLSLETISIGFWGTVLGIVFSFPIGFLSAKNVSTNPIVYSISKAVVNFLRAVPDIMYAILFVTSLGMGSLAGILALTLSTVGLLGKFYAEAIESIDSKPMEAIAATGSHGLGIIRHAILPQVFPLFMGYNLYLLDHNIRAAMALGLVGAGGLGVELFTQMRSFNYQKASAVLTIIFLIITAIDRLSANLRKDIIEGTIFSKGKKVKNSIFIILVSAISIISLFHISVSFKDLLAGIPKILSFLKGLFPPDLSNTSEYLKLMIETVAMGISGTFLAIIISIPIGALSTRNLLHNVYIHNLMREVSNFFRAMPELMLALIFVTAVGLGPFAGVLAIAIHTAGFLSKFYAEAIENIDERPIEAVMAVGARFTQVMRHAVFPQVMPLFNSYNLFLLDRNIRVSTVMGIVGAGGIGFELVMSMKIFEYQKTSTLIMIVLFTIGLVDWLSLYLRKRCV